MSPEARAAAAAEASRIGEAIDLAQIRQARKLSQAEIGRALHIGQASVAKIEKRTDMYVSTLRRFIEATGGELEIVARFPDHTIRIRQFSDLARQDDDKPKRVGIQRTNQE
jgi:transcriptional regulator with XRE-family HTH domain